ncbi:MAG TPA: M28 family peptidase, partial [Candidatus Lokiarchaeia archaeon]|nr:M28 family peptidase [Candidatus Lokiarchaeia archaeon]
DSSAVEQFKVTPDIYPRGIVRVAAIFIVAGVIFSFFNLPSLFFAILLPIVGLLTFWAGMFKRKAWFGWAYKKQTSHNSFGRINPLPTNSDGVAPVQILVGGHLDSAYEMNIADNEKYFVPITVAGIGFGIIMILLCLIKAILLLAIPSSIILIIAPNGYLVFTGIDICQIVVIVVLGPCFARVVRGYGFGKPVLGANDNLAGVGVACAVGKHFTEPHLHYVELVVGGFGSEEIGDRGAEAYAHIHGSKAEQKNTIVVVPESCGAGYALAVVEKEKMHGATHDPQLCGILMEAYNRYKNNTPEPIPCDIRTLGFAGTDAGPFSLAGFRATAIVGIAGVMNKPAHWHSRHDTPDNLDATFLQAVIDIICHFVEMVEEKQGLLA